MNNVSHAIAFFSAALRRFDQRRIGDRRYIDIRRCPGDILERYAADPTNLEVVSECDSLVRDLQNLSSIDLSDLNYQRSQTNMVYISAQSKRTHYAAYMAGKWSQDENLGSPFKAWMHNSAADGAISLFEAIRQFSDKTRNPINKAELDLLEIFGHGAVHDAARFLTLADTFYPGCVVTIYNRAKLAIYTKEGSKVREGIERLKTIPTPADDCHSAELIWHLDNYRSYQYDRYMRNLIEIEHADELVRIDQALKNNHDAAKAIKEDRGESLWQPQTQYTKAMVLGAAAGIILTIYIVLGHGDLKDLVELLMSHAHIAESIVGASPIQFGGGGLASAALTSIFGGGGLA